MYEFLPKMAKMTLFAIFDRTTSEPKICSRNVWNMVGTSFESWKSTFYEKIFCINFFSTFCVFLEQKRYDWFSVLDNTVLVPKRHKKLRKFFEKYFFVKWRLSAFKRRSNHVPNVSRTDFRIWCSSVENGKKCHFCNFSQKIVHLLRNINFEPNIAETF